MIRHFTASGIVLDDQYRVLLIDHRKHGIWMGPGGHLHENEDPVQGFVREVGEECGIEVRIIAEERFTHPSVTVLPAPFTILVEDIPGPDGGIHQHIDLTYIARASSVHVTPQEGEIRDWAWVHPRDIGRYVVPQEYPVLVEAAVMYAKNVTARQSAL